jgi:hypothetical protein
MTNSKKKPKLSDLKKVSIPHKDSWGRYPVKSDWGGFRPMTKEEIKKYRATKPVDLHLTRKDAKNLKSCLDINHDEWTKDMWPTRERILSKLKREGVR